MKLATSMAFAALAAAACSASAQTELTTNGDFETGDGTGWLYLPTGSSDFFVGSDANSGSFGGQLDNFGEASAALIRQTNIGAGVVQPGEEITISFWAKASNGEGGVNFAEFFSESTTNGVTKAEILGGAPLFPPENTWQFYQFTTTAAADVSAGVTLTLTATTGAVVGGFSQLFVDDVSVTVGSAPVCQPDVNGDGVLDNGDISAYVVLFLAGGAAADFNGDGILDNGDIGAFVVAFLQGC